MCHLPCSPNHRKVPKWSSLGRYQSINILSYLIVYCITAAGLLYWTWVAGKISNELKVPCSEFGRFSPSLVWTNTLVPRRLRDPQTTGIKETQRHKLAEQKEKRQTVGIWCSYRGPAVHGTTGTRYTYGRSRRCPSAVSDNTLQCQPIASTVYFPHAVR